MHPYDPNNYEAGLLLPVQLTDKADPTKRNGANGKDTTIQFLTSSTDTNINAVAWIAASDSTQAQVMSGVYLPRMPQLVASSGSIPGITYCRKLKVIFDDQAGNRLTEQMGTATTSSVYNELNQLTGQTGGGWTHFTGTVNKPAVVTVGGNPATVDSFGHFDGAALLGTGTNTVPLTATDANGNVATSKYQVTISGSSTGGYLYDADGNLSSDGSATYEWDAANRVIAINEGNGLRTQFTYDGMGRWVSITESSGGTVMSTRNLVWSGMEIAEERDQNGEVTKRYFPQGVQVGGADYFYTRDHLGSIREVVDAGGGIQARYDYDPYGRAVKLSGTMSADFGFTGAYVHQPSGLNLTMYRGYAPGLGRWISRDPLGEAGGINLYGYVGNQPTELTDPSGLSWWNPFSWGEGPSPYLPDPGQKPPGWNPNWNTGSDNRGPYSQPPDGGPKWYPHPEDNGHWPHYDNDSGGRYPNKCVKPWPNQQKPPYGDQSKDNPWPKTPPEDDGPPWWAPIIDLPEELFPLFGLPPDFGTPPRRPSIA